MAEARPGDSKPAHNPALVILFMSAVLIFNIWKAVAWPGGEYSPDLLTAMYFGLDVALTVLVVVLLVGLRAAPPGPLRTIAYIVGPLGFAAGAAMVWVRLSGDVGWFTGHVS